MIEIVAILAKGIQYTLLVSISAFVFGLLIAVPVTAARLSPSLILRLVGTCYVEILRGIPPLPWLFIVYFGLPTLGVKVPPIPAGILVFSLIAGAYLTEIYRAGFRSVPAGQLEAGDALGLPRGKTYALVLIPQALRTMLPLSIAYLIGLLKDSAIVSMVGVQDISTLALVANRSTGQGLLVFVVASLLYLILSVPIAVFGRWLGTKLTAPSQRRAKASTTTEAVTIP